MKKKIRAVVVFSIVLPLVFLTSCNSDGPEIEKPEKIYYDLAQRRMKANNFFSAIESLEAIEARYPFGRYAEQAQSELIYAYFMNGEDEASHEAAEKFIRLNPRHPNIDYAYFMRGIASYTRDKGMFARVFKSLGEVTSHTTNHGDDNSQLRAIDDGYHKDRVGAHVGLS